MAAAEQIKSLIKSFAGQSIIRQFEQAVADFERNIEDDFVYLVFKSPPGFLLDLQKLEDSAGNFRLKSYKQLFESEDDNGTHFYYEAKFLARASDFYGNVL